MFCRFQELEEENDNRHWKEYIQGLEKLWCDIVNDESTIIHLWDSIGYATSVNPNTNYVTWEKTL